MAKARCAVGSLTGARRAGGPQWGWRSRVRVRIDPDSCFHCGLCAELCPAVFEVDFVLVRASFERVPEGSERQVFDAAAQCPRGSIWLAEVPKQLLANVG